MNEESYEEHLATELEKLRNIQKEYGDTREGVIETLKRLKNTQMEYINLVRQHQEFWNKELEKTEYENTVRRDELKKTLINEEKILKKLEKELKHIEERIEFHKKHNIR